MRLRSRVGPALLAALTATLAGVSGARAQSGNGFLFSAPKLELGAQVGVGIATAGSDLFDFTQEELTLGRADFMGVSLFGDATYLLAPRLGITVAAGYVRSNSGSEFRDWIGEDDLPITQTTEFLRAPITAGLKVYPLGRGRQVGRYAWIPATMVPYVGGAAGGIWYRFHQNGDFVDSESLDIFYDDLSSSGWAPAAQAFGGLSYSLTPHWSVTGEGRYTWASAELSDSFEGFDPIDLAGMSVTLGVSVRY